MKKQLLSSVFLLAVASNALAITYSFSDADRFGSLVTSGTNPPVGAPAGVTLQATGGTASVSGSFDIINPDGDSSFLIGAPYGSSDRKTYNSVLGFVPGKMAIETGQVKIFLRDLDGGTETAVFNAVDLSLNKANFTSTLILGNITAALAASLDASGSFNYTVTATAGRFVLDAAYLEVEATSIPDGGSTVALLGSALMVGAFFRRKVLLA